MLKNINKFSKLTIIFTVSYILIGIFALSDTILDIIYSIRIPSSWIPDFVYKNPPLLRLLLNTSQSIPDYFFWIIVGSVIVLVIMAVITGIIAVVQTEKTKEKGKWIALIITLLNITLWLGIIAVEFF